MTRKITKLDPILCFGLIFYFLVDIDQGNDQEKSLIIVVLDESCKFFYELIFFDFDIGRYCFGQIFNGLAIKVSDKEVFIVLLNKVVIFLAERDDVGNGLLASDGFLILFIELFLVLGELDLLKFQRGLNLFKLVGRHV